MDVPDILSNLCVTPRPGLSALHAPHRSLPGPMTSGLRMSFVSAPAVVTEGSTRGPCEEK